MTPQQKIATRLYELLPHKKIETKYPDSIYEDSGGNFDYAYSLGIEQGEKYEQQKIRLADILLALSKVDEGVNYTLYERCFYKVDIYSQMYSRCVEYNLEKDNILDQSDSFCEFLLEILK